MKLTVLAAAAALALLAAPVVAAPLAITKDIATAVAVDSAVERVHFGHGSCQLGRFGWHFHRYGNRIECKPFKRVRRVYRSYF
jgi:hypothetical protein